MNEPQFVEVGDLTMAYETFGAGEDLPPLVLVHGITGARTDFAHVAPKLAADRRVITVDNRGHLDTSASPDPADYSLEQLATDLAGFLAAVTDEPVDLLGHSMGGMVTLRLAIAHPELVRSLIFMDTGARAPEMPFDIDDDLMALVVGTVEEHGVDAARAIMSDRDNPERKLLDELRGPEVMQADEDRRYAAMDPGVITHLAPIVFTHESILDAARSIRKPTTVMAGANDGPFVETSRELAEAIDGAVFHEIEGAYHSPQWSHEELWLALVRDHLAALD